MTQKNRLSKYKIYDISSAVLLAFYDFQPKYYNQYFMEIGKYENKSKERTFIKIKFDEIIFNEVKASNIGWYILFNFTNIRDQIHNAMLRTINEEFIKIDIRTFNSEYKQSKISRNLDYILNNMNIFKKNKKIIVNELNKILIINEEFLLDLIIFRVKRGCFNNINKEDLAINFDCISSSYKVMKLNNLDDFSVSFENYKKTFNNKHFENNLALSWMLYNFFVNQVLTQIEYEDYINKFNEKAEKFEQIAIKIRNEEIPNVHLKEDKLKEDNLKKEAIDIEDNAIDKENKKIDDNNIYLPKDKKDNIENKEFENNELPKYETLELKINHNIRKRINIKNGQNNNVKNINITTTETNKKKEQKKFCWFCCGKESVDVID